MNDHDKAIRMAQRLLTQRAKQFSDVENANREYEPNPRRQAYISAAEELDVLVGLAEGDEG